MVDIAFTDPLLELKNKANEYISVENALHLISKKLGCSIAVAAEIILLKLPDENDWHGNPINPSFFGKKVGVSTFSYCDDRPMLRTMLLNIIENNPNAFAVDEPPTDFDDDIPF
ncbi:hypothetical protein [Pectobacterium carotovorum]|uniref:hypothetical protein n=1 Tax=Pectobacterium carotovorum TaxID=554 RepID=UPI003015D220